MLKAPISLSRSKCNPRNITIYSCGCASSHSANLASIPIFYMACNIAKVNYQSTHSITVALEYCYHVRFSMTYSVSDLKLTKTFSPISRFRISTPYSRANKATSRSKSTESKPNPPPKKVVSSLISAGCGTSYDGGGLLSLPEEQRLRNGQGRPAIVHSLEEQDLLLLPDDAFLAATLLKKADAGVAFRGPFEKLLGMVEMGFSSSSSRTSSSCC